MKGFLNVGPDGRISIVTDEGVTDIGPLPPLDVTDWAKVRALGTESVEGFSGWFDGDIDDA